MAGRLLRRGGVAVTLIAKLLEWEPTVIFQVGIGNRHGEVEVMKAAWPDVEFVGWEPHPEIVDGLKDYPGLVHREALSNWMGKSQLFYEQRYLGGASLYGMEGLSSVDVDVTMLDAIYAGLKWRRPNDRVMLWLDCEGSELNALRGGEEFVRGVDVVNVELTGVPHTPGWPAPVEVNRWLLDHGFLLQYIHTHRCTSGQNDMVYVKPELFRPEYCSSPLQIEDHRRRFGGSDAFVSP